MANKGRTTHGHTTGGIETTEYRAYSLMKNKCYNPNYIRYDLYGGKGIKVCEEWCNSFITFFNDMGIAPPGAILGRLDENEDFSPDNCRWMSKGDYFKSLPSSYSFREKQHTHAG